MLTHVDPKALLEELLGCCRMLGLAVRGGPMKVPATRLAGGLVRLRGTPVVIVDTSAPVVDRVAAVADAICELEIDPIGLSADARAAVVQARRRRKRARTRLRRQGTQPLTSYELWRDLRPRPSVSRCRGNGQSS